MHLQMKSIFSRSRRNSPLQGGGRPRHLEGRFLALVQRIPVPHAGQLQFPCLDQGVGIIHD